MNRTVPLPLRLEPVVSRTPLAGRQMPSDSFFDAFLIAENILL